MLGLGPALVMQVLLIVREGCCQLKLGAMGAQASFMGLCPSSTVDQATVGQLAISDVLGIGIVDVQSCTSIVAEFTHPYDSICVSVAEYTGPGFNLQHC